MLKQTKSFLVLGVTVLTVAVTACGSAGSSSTASTTPVVAGTGPSTTKPAVPSAGAVDPNAPEVVEPGDIPDDQVFVAFTQPGSVYSVEVPEGWARTEQNGAVTFTDKYNSVSIQAAPATAPPTVDSVKSNALADVASDPTFKLVDVTPVTRNAGEGVLATFEIGSPPNPVTGKKALLAVERYVFFHNGTQVSLTLSGAAGADNVDPWKIVSDSMSWV
jgi:hypothetical protein